MEEENNQPLVHDFNDTAPKSFFSLKLILVLVIVALLGVGGGYFLSKKGGNLTPGSITQLGGSSAGKGTVFGSDKTTGDTAEGILKEGGIEGEGQFHLVRPGGDSQNVYLTSSNVDLSKIIGKKVKVWGETQKAKTAGWLMDATRVEVLE